MQVTIKKSARAKYIRLAVYADGRVVLTQPKRASVLFVEKFLKSKWKWVEGKLAHFRKNAEPGSRVGHGMTIPPSGMTRTAQRKEYLKNKQEALVLVKERLEYFNRFYNFSYNKVTVRNQKTRWGSCSKRGNLNFNYKILFLSPEERDYIVVHELCHLAEFNHSKSFWALVAKQISQYKDLRAGLKKFKI